MAFFGLTALGSQDPFASLSKTYAILNIFDEEEFKQGFNHVAGSKGKALNKPLPPLFNDGTETDGWKGEFYIFKLVPADFNGKELVIFIGWGGSNYQQLSGKRKARLINLSHCLFAFPNIALNVVYFQAKYSIKTIFLFRKTYLQSIDKSSLVCNGKSRRLESQHILTI